MVVAFDIVEQGQHAPFTRGFAGRPLHHQAIVKLAAFHYTEELARELAKTPQTQKPIPPETQTPAKPADPQACLKQALKGMLVQNKAAPPPC